MFNFAQNLSRIRRQQSLTQQNVAERLNLTFQPSPNRRPGSHCPTLNS